MEKLVGLFVAVAAGLMLAGFLIDRLGFPLTVTVLVTAGLGCTVLIGLTWRASLWRRPHSRSLSTVQRA